MICIDNGKTVKEYYTHPKTEEAIQTLLDDIEDLFSSETFDEIKITIVKRKGNRYDT